jgi:hypothetical protein
MKLGFKRGDKWYSTIVRVSLCSQYSHSAIEINGRLYEAVALKNGRDRAGVRDYDLDAETASHYEWFDLGTSGEVDALLAYSKVAGHGYDFCSLLDFVTMFKIRDSKREYCHELTALMLGLEEKYRVTPEKILTHVIRKLVK